jgi:hypothetical protein
MIRVGFRLIGGAAWQGGRNYLWNLLYAITKHAADRIQPVLLLAPNEEPDDLALDGVELFRTGALTDSSPARALGRAMKLVRGPNLVEEHWLHRARIDVYSHAPPVGTRVTGRTPTISWVPDLQHRHLPELAATREGFMRDLLFREMLRDATIVLVSSETALRDLREFYPTGRAMRRVLRFVGQPRVPVSDMIPLAQLRQSFGVPSRFFHLPNQLWKHKNHGLVVDALREVPDAVVVATGPTEDYRHPGLLTTLLERVKELGLGDRFVHLGLVSFREMLSLMTHSVAVINPSRFEGWSTTVEEAKSLGKRVLVSDLAVHREQAPARGSYFPVDAPSVLAAQMREAWASHDPTADARATEEAAGNLPARTRAFANTYAALARDALRGPEAG